MVCVVCRRDVKSVWTGDDGTLVCDDCLERIADKECGA